MNENIKNMVEELKREFPKSVCQELDLIIYDNDGNIYSEDDDKLFDETILDEVRIYYKQQTISIERNYENNWEIEDEDYIKFEDFREIGKILSIVMKHISKIELD